MTNYEGIFIIDPDIATDAQKNTVTQVQELVSKNGGRVDGVQDWGKKRMAYKIRKKNDGNYVVLNFQMDPKNSKKLDQSLRLNDNIMRFLVVNKDEL